MADALMPLLRLFGGGRRSPADPPLRGDLLGIEGLEQRARALAASFTLDPRREGRRVQRTPRAARPRTVARA